MLPERPADLRLWLTGAVDVGEMFWLDMFWLQVKQSLTRKRIRFNVYLDSATSKLERIREGPRVAYRRILKIIMHGLFTKSLCSPVRGSYFLGFAGRTDGRCA